MPLHYTTHASPWEGRGIIYRTFNHVDRTFNHVDDRQTLLARDADALSNIKVEVVLHYQSLGINPVVWEHSALRVLYPDSRN